MSSRAQQKAAARRHREALEAARQRRKMLARLALVSAAALALVAVVVTLARLGGDDTPASAQPAAVAARYTGIPQTGIALGAPSAPATLIEFADLQCPFCGVYARDVLPSVVADYVRPGKLRLELNVLAFVGEDSLKAVGMAAAAALQNRLWDFTDAFYARQGQENTGYVTDEFLSTVGTTAGLDLAAARAAQGGAPAKAVLDKAQGAATRRGVQSTPSFFVRHSDGTATPVKVSELTPGGFASALDAALAR